MKAVKAALGAKGASSDEISAFEKSAAAYAKKIVANFKDYEFYTGSSMTPEGMFVILSPLLSNQYILTHYVLIGLLFSTTAMTVPPLTLPSGSTALLRRRSKEKSYINTLVLSCYSPRMKYLLGSSSPSFLLLRATCFVPV